MIIGMVYLVDKIMMYLRIDGPSLHRALTLCQPRHRDTGIDRWQMKPQTCEEQRETLKFLSDVLFLSVHCMCTGV